jgi:acyl carrier protein
MREELQEIFRTVLGDDSIELDAETRAVDLPGWDSLMHINTMFSVEQAFGVQFLGDEFARVQTIGQLEALVESKRAA